MLYRFFEDQDCFATSEREREEMGRGEERREEESGRKRRGEGFGGLEILTSHTIKEIWW